MSRFLIETDTATPGSLRSEGRFLQIELTDSTTQPDNSFARIIDNRSGYVQTQAQGSLAGFSTGGSAFDVEESDERESAYNLLAGLIGTLLFALLQDPETSDDGYAELLQQFAETTRSRVQGLRSWYRTQETCEFWTALGLRTPTSDREAAKFIYGRVRRAMKEGNLSQLKAAMDGYDIQEFQRSPITASTLLAATQSLDELKQSRSNMADRIRDAWQARFGNTDWLDRLIR